MKITLSPLANELPHSLQCPENLAVIVDGILSLLFSAVNVFPPDPALIPVIEPALD
jgi:hypothetical protein